MPAKKDKPQHPVDESNPPEKQETQPQQETKTGNNKTFDQKLFTYHRDQGWIRSKK